MRLAEREVSALSLHDLGLRYKALVPEALVHFQEENRLEEHRRHGATSLHLGKYVHSMTPKTLDFRRGTQDKTRVHVCTRCLRFPARISWTTVILASCVVIIRAVFYRRSICTPQQSRDGFFLVLRQIAEAFLLSFQDARDEMGIGDKVRIQTNIFCAKLTYTRKVPWMDSTCHFRRPQ